MLAELRFITLRYIISCHVMLCRVMLCHVMLCHVMSRYVTSCYVVLCYVMFELKPYIYMINSLIYLYTHLLGASEQGSAGSGQSTRRLTLTMTLLADACTPGQGVGSGTVQGQGSTPSKEASRDVRLTLFALAAVLAGCTVRTSDRNAFPRNRWLPPAFKCFILSALGCHSQAGFDLLADRPDLQNLFLDPESESGGSEVLPHPYCSLGRLITMQAVIMARKAITGVCLCECVCVCEYVCVCVSM
jgi:hypothetical protein